MNVLVSLLAVVYDVPAHNKEQCVGRKNKMRKSTFFHLLDGSGSIVSSSDALGVAIRVAMGVVLESNVKYSTT
jgi:hypothetical protein